MILDNQGPDESEFFSPDDVPTSENADTGANDEAADDTADVEEDDEPELDEFGEPIVKAEEPDDTADDEFEEIEHAGKKHKIPKELKPLLLMQQDYTRKTQEVAESRKALENDRARAQAEIAQQAETARQFTSEIAQLHTIDERLQQYAQVDWKAWKEQDWMQANDGYQEYQLLKEQRGQVASALQQKDNQARQEREKRSRDEQQAQEAETAKLREETLHAVKAAIPSWNSEVATKVSEFAQRNGYSYDELVNATADPRAFILLHKAWRGEQLEAQQKAAAKKAQADIQPQGKPLTPVAKGRAAPATAGLDDRLPADEWARRRNEQLRSRGR